MFKLLTDRLISRSLEEQGEVSLEYVLVGGLMAAAIVAGMVTMDTAVGSWFTGIAADIGAALP